MNTTPQPTPIFDEMFLGNYGQLLGWCKRHVPPELGDPEDFVHATYLRSRKHWAATRRSRDRGAAYLYRAIHWVVLDALRRKTHSRLEPHAASVPRERRGSIPLRELILQEAIRALPPRQSQVCVALLAGKGDHEIRRELNLSAGAMAVRLSRAKRSLCRFLEVSPSHS